MVRYGAIWTQMAIYHMGPHMALLYGVDMGPYGVHIWAHMDPYGPIWIHMAQMFGRPKVLGDVNHQDVGRVMHTLTQCGMIDGSVLFVL